MPSIKRNFVYSTILTTANYIFPLLVYPYVSRVLGVTNIGLCNFIDSIINYFILFSMMGITVMGVREIASCRDDCAGRSTAYSSLLTLNAVTTLVSIVVLAICTVCIARLRENYDLMLVGAVKLLFNLFLIEWFYKGIEDFRYITVRTIAVRMLYVAAVFIFVQNRDDVLIYFALTALTVVLNAVINIAHARRFVKFSFKGISFRPYLGSFLILGLYAFLNSMYTTFNVTYLGFISNDEQVGYYTTATKIYTLLLSVYTAYTGVMFPRMSSLAAEGKLDEFRQKMKGSMHALIIFSIPVIVFMSVFARPMILLLCGPGYEGAVTPLLIVMPLMLIIGYEQILVIQALMPLKADKVIFRNSILGATTGVLLNVLLVGTMGALGSAIVWVCAEILILLFSQIAVKRLIQMSFPASEILKTCLFYLPLAVVLYFCNVGISNYIIALAVGAMLTILYFGFLNAKALGKIRLR